MRRHGSWILGLAAAACAAIAIGAGADAGADAIPPPPDCPAWQTVRWRGSRHAGASCVPRACRQDRECGPGSRCGRRRACFVEVETWVSPGPCRDRDGDGVCDGRRRVVETRESGPCDADGTCATHGGECRPVRECTPPTTGR